MEKIFAPAEITNNAYDLKDNLTADIDNVTDLIPNNGRKSFYGKAKVINLVNGTKILKSYDTYVACILPDGKYLSNGMYSNTTASHQRSFASEFATQYDMKHFENNTLAKSFYND